MNWRKFSAKMFQRYLMLLPLYAALMNLFAYSAAAQSGVSSENGMNVALPSAEKIVENYWRAIGGRKRAAQFHNAVYEWTAELTDGAGSTAETRLKAPASWRMDVHLGDGRTISVAANARAAWRRNSDGAVQTLIDKDARDAKLCAALWASRLIDYKKANINARTVGMENSRDEPAYLVEFSTPDGARCREAFGAKSGLLLWAGGETSKDILFFKDYRLENNWLEPHRIESISDGRMTLALTLRAVRYNTNFDETIFDPPHEASSTAKNERIDVAQLLREVARHQHEIDERLGQYTFKMKETVHVFNDKGKVYQEQTKESEVYPVPGRRPVLKLLSENGAPLSPERAAKETKRAGEELEKAEREREKERAREAARREKRAANGARVEGDEEAEDARLFLGAMTRACEFVAPRREHFREREAIVFDFRPRVGYKPQNHLESLVASLTGIVWVDPVDKQFMRFEARTLKGFKIAGGFVASVKPGASLVFEQTRTADNIWMPRTLQFDGAMKFLLLMGANVRFAQEWSDYQRFNTETKDVKIDAPKRSKP